MSVVPALAIMAALAGKEHKEPQVVETIWREPKDDEEKKKLDALKRKYRDNVFLTYSWTAIFGGCTFLLAEYMSSMVVKDGVINPFTAPAWVLLALGIVGLSIVRDEVVDNFVVLLRTVSEGFNENPLKWLDSITGAPHFTGPMIAGLTGTMAAIMFVAMSIVDRHGADGKTTCPKCRFDWAYNLIYFMIVVTIVVLAASYQGIRKFFS